MKIPPTLGPLTALRCAALRDCRPSAVSRSGKTPRDMDGGSGACAPDGPRVGGITMEREDALPAESCPIPTTCTEHRPGAVSARPSDDRSADSDTRTWEPTRHGPSLRNRAVAVEVFRREHFLEMPADAGALPTRERVNDGRVFAGVEPHVPRLARVYLDSRESVTRADSGFDCAASGDPQGVDQDFVVAPRRRVLHDGNIQPW